MFPDTDPFEMYIVIEAITHQYNNIRSQWPFANSMMPIVPSTRIYQMLSPIDTSNVFWCIDWLAYHHYLKCVWKPGDHGVERWISAVHMD
jgi:hypothetical protein